MQVLQTKKRHDIITLPGNRSTVLNIPNNITYAQYNFTLLQERLFNYVIYNLRHHVKKIFEGTVITQLDIFKDTSDEIDVMVPLSEIASHPQFKDVREAAEGMAQTTIKIGKRNIQGKFFDTIEGIFSRVMIPSDQKRSNYIIIQVKKEIAFVLVNFTINDNNKPCNYTNYIYEVCMDAKSKYTPRIYKIISRWKDLGGLTITVDELCDTLQLEKSYRKAHNIRRNILEPAQRELQNKSDIWFNCADIEYITEGKKVTAFRFKIIEPETEKLNEIYTRQIYEALQWRFKLDNMQINELRPIIDNPGNHEALTKKLIQLEDIFLEDNNVSVKNRRIRNRTTYTVTAIKTLFQAQNA